MSSAQGSGSNQAQNGAGYQNNNPGEQRPAVNGNAVNGNIMNGNTVNGNTVNGIFDSDHYDNLSSQIEFTEDQESLGSEESDDSDDAVSVGHPNTPVDNPEEDKSATSEESSDEDDTYSEDMDDSNFGDTESNGDGEDDIESPWPESETDTSPEPTDQNHSSEQNNERQGNEDHDDGGIRSEREGLSDSGPDNSTSGNLGHLGECWASEAEAEHSPREYAPFVPRRDFLRAIIRENRRLPANFDPEMAFDDSENQQGPFSVPGQIWEDLSSDDLGSPMATEMSLETFEPVFSPSPYEGSSDANKENLAPQTDDQANTNNNSLDEGPANPPSGTGHERSNHELFGPLRPLPPWAFE